MEENYESAIDSNSYALVQTMETKNNGECLENINEASPKYVLKPSKENFLNGLVAQDIKLLQNNICTVGQMNESDQALLKELFFDLATNKSTPSLKVLEFLLNNAQVRTLIKETIGRTILNTNFEDSIERYNLLLKAYYSDTKVNFYYNEHGFVTHEWTMDKAVQSQITKEFYKLLNIASDGKDGWDRRYIHLDKEFYYKAQLLLKYGARVSTDTIRLILSSDPFHQGNTHIRELLEAILTDRTEQIKKLKNTDLVDRDFGYKKIAYFIDILTSKGINIAQENGWSQEPILRSLLGYRMASRESDKNDVIDAIQKFLIYGMPKTEKLYVMAIEDEDIPKEALDLLNPKNQNQKLL